MSYSVNKTIHHHFNDERSFKYYVIGNWICVWLLFLYYVFTTCYVYWKEVVLEASSICLWVLKNILLETFLCMQCEKFYSALKEAQDICILILK
ncbi:uncharacterized protein LOC142982816, partial [Anticarsia gemmatalis]|uniref:uncharacterized protein LOC142982816 n=1 Tax=Anticarsia gemmatalis TaxID=129554 RepID=UPI003F76169E